MDRELHIRFLRDMLRARRLEERIAQEYTRANIGGFLHLYPGEEAVAVGVLAAAEPADYVVSTYREHIHALARGIPMRAIVAELFGRRDGCSRGLGGSMHLFDAERRFLGGYAIVGETYPIATGAAYAVMLRGLPEAVICFFGDGAVNQGTFHESLNMAALWKLPVLFVCENNHYQIGTEIHRHSAVTEVYKRASAYNIPAAKADGMDVEAVHTHTRETLERVRGGQGPQLLEFETYRYRGHSMADPGSYRPAVEVAAYTAQDPIAAEMRELALHYPDAGTLHELGLDSSESLGRRYVENGHLDTAGLDALEADIRAEIEDAVAFAQASPEPTLDDARHALRPGLIHEALI
jgi:pyruvate dehydrogenase E1 component alpha subunit